MQQQRAGVADRERQQHLRLALHVGFRQPHAAAEQAMAECTPRCASKPP